MRDDAGQWEWGAFPTAVLMGCRVVLVYSTGVSRAGKEGGAWKA